MDVTGFRPQRTVYKLKFEDPAMAGLVVRLRGLTVGELVEFSRLKVDGGPEQLEQVFGVFASKLVDWNLLDDQDQPVPATYEGLAAQEQPFALALVDAWMTEVAGLPAPLAGSSTSGPPSALAQLPMETLPASQAS